MYHSISLSVTSSERSSLTIFFEVETHPYRPVYWVECILCCAALAFCSGGSAALAAECCWQTVFSCQPFWGIASAAESKATPPPRVTHTQWGVMVRKLQRVGALQHSQRGGFRLWLSLLCHQLLSVSASSYFSSLSHRC